MTEVRLEGAQSARMVGDPTQPTVGRTYRRLWRWHFYAALLVIPFVLWQSGTGLLYLWANQWTAYQYPDLVHVHPDGAKHGLSDQVRTALATAPDRPVISIEVPPEPDRSTVVMLKGADGLPQPVFVDPYRDRVLGTLTPTHWLLGLSRQLHGGWPLGAPGSWLLELGNCWAIVMVLTGLYLWWPRGRRHWLSGLVPRLGGGSRVFWRDLHGCVAAWFSIVVLAFLISALPWTKFWGGQILKPIQRATHQTSPAGFSPGGARPDQVLKALPALDQAMVRIQAEGLGNGLSARLSARHGSPWRIQTKAVDPLDEHVLLVSSTTGAVLRDVTRDQLPLIAGLVALGINLHQGDFGWVNRWGNTLVAVALIWVVISGFMSWLRRRPGQGVAAPAAPAARWPRWLVATAVVMSVLLPLFGLSVLLVLLIDWLWRKWRPPVGLSGRPA